MFNIDIAISNKIGLGKYGQNRAVVVFESSLLIKYTEGVFYYTHRVWVNKKNVCIYTTKNIIKSFHKTSGNIRNNNWFDNCNKSTEKAQYISVPYIREALERVSSFGTSQPC